jgi:hypothetical protein
MVQRHSDIPSVFQKDICEERLRSLGDPELHELRNGLLNIVEAWEDALKAAPPQPLRQDERERPLRAMRQIMLRVLAEAARRQEIRVE